MMFNICNSDALFVPCRFGWSATPTLVCISLFFVAAAFLALCAKPSRRGEAVQRLYGGTLLEPFEVDEAMVAANNGEPMLSVRCLDGGRVVFDRIGVDGLTRSGAVSLAVEQKGADVEVKERVSAGYHSDPPMAGASFTVEFRGSEWIHVLWTDEESGLWTAFTLHLRPGLRTIAKLRR